MAQDAYGDVGARDDYDLDLLIAEQQLPTATEVLESYGLAFIQDPGPTSITREMLKDPASRRYYPHAEFGVPGSVVEVHWRLAANPKLFPVGPVTPRALHVAGITIPALPMPEAFFYAMVHGTKHAWFRLKWIADVAALVRQRPHLAAVSTLEEAQRAGLERCVATGLLMAERVLGPFLLDDARDWTQSIRGTRALVRLSSWRLSATEQRSERTPLDGLTTVRLGLSMRSDTNYRLEEIVQLLVSAGRLQQGKQPPGSWALAKAPFSYLARLVRRTLRSRADAFSRSSRS
jgi:hypothetical protein